MSKRLIIMPVLSGFFIMGFCDIVGITSDYVQDTFGWSSAMTGFVPSMVFIWFLFLGIPAGNLMNRIGRKNTVLLSMAVTATGMFLPLAVFNGITCMAAFALLGIGNAILQVSLNSLLGNVVTDSKLLTSSLTAGQVIKAISSLAGPEIVIVALAWSGRWQACFPILGALTVASALWLLVTPVEREPSSSGGTSVMDALKLLRDRKMLMLFLGIFFVVGVDVGTNFISSKLMAARFGWAGERAKFAPQAYFLCRTAGALLGAVLLARLSEVKYFRANIICAAVAIVCLMFAGGSVMALASIGATGFFCSSVFSIIYSMALRHSPDKANMISGLMITAVAGGGIVTPVMGAAIDISGLAGGLAIILLCTIYLTFCAFSCPAAKA